MNERGEHFRDAALICILHMGVCIAARAILNFDHVSDDDFARVTIAQTFAHAPKLDPSGTSWLPFPFWSMGGLMIVFGRSLATARAISIVLASIAAAFPYLALRHVGIARKRALFATALAFGTPWAVWLGATTVPESMTASLTAAATIGLSALVTAPVTTPWASASARRSPWLFAAAMFAACLSRYETWPVAAIVGFALTVRAARAGGRYRNKILGLALVCALGPLVWMAWNAHAHDGPLHFFRRVSSFKRLIGDGSTSTFEAIVLYPKLLFTSRPEVSVFALLLLPSLREKEVRDRWALPLLAALAQLIFLSYGNARDGSAAHHPERALLATQMLVALFVADEGISDLTKIAKTGKLRMAQAIAAAAMAIWLTWIVRSAEVPGTSESEDRSVQIKRGESLRKEGAAAIAVTPCGFEHFALLAAYGTPESATVAPRTGITPTAECPRVDR